MLNIFFIQIKNNCIYEVLFSESADLFMFNSFYRRVLRESLTTCIKPETVSSCSSIDVN